MVWIIAAGVAVVLLTLCGLTAYAVLRASTRQRVAAWRRSWILGLGFAAIIPWLVVWFAPIRIVVNIKTLGPLIGWLVLALAAFALLVLLPLAALLSTVVWARTSRGGTSAASRKSE